MRKQVKKQLCESMEYLVQTSDTIGELLGRLDRNRQWISWHRCSSL